MLVPTIRILSPKDTTSGPESKKWHARTSRAATLLGMKSGLRACSRVHNSSEYKVESSVQAEVHNELCQAYPPIPTLQLRMRNIVTFRWNPLYVFNL